MASMSLSKTFRAASLPPICDRNTAVITGSFNFSKFNQMRGFFVMRLLFNFSFIVVNTKSWSLPMYAPGNILVLALLMLDLKRCGASMKSVWMCTCPSEACHVVVLDDC
ncbi:hypothetical protein DPMN_009330 [Dreissena polymorpha]|uniref:Uncharacterized protein n=1 Tax=Dreissena polymorpha TaxID=45954 RepID=A0A9D4MZE4_DREPO|nr:hypothetical protein DPMN_009330 [Dreissena polymorpha]